MNDALELIYYIYEKTLQFLFSSYMFNGVSIGMVLLTSFIFIVLLRFLVAIPRINVNVKPDRKGEQIMWTYPEDSCVIITDEYNLGDIEIYVPCDRVNCFTWDGDDLINVCASNISGYMNYGNNDYTVSFQPYRTGTVRLSGNTYTTSFVMSDTEINFQTRVPTDNFSIGFIGIFGLAILGGLLWMTFIRH